MQAIFDPVQMRHDPQNFMALGAQHPSPEQPRRAEVLRAGAEAAGCTFTAPPDQGLAPIAAIHTPEYLTFLQTIHARWSALPGAGPEVVPNIHPHARTDTYPTGPVGQAGYHQADTGCPIGPQTWASAYGAAQSAIAGADIVAGGARAAYVLARPPGHHAYADMAGGFCFLNNSAIAAERLRATGYRPAILDVDVHHGNGTQGIFYSRADILTVSVHADPSRFYPHFWGYAGERGAGAGLGYNLNLPLAMGQGDTEFLDALIHAQTAISNFGADVLVIALGLDASEDDPFQALKVTRTGFARIGAAIASMGLPTLLVQEGGYLSDSLGGNLTAALTGFQDAA